MERAECPAEAALVVRIIKTAHAPVALSESLALTRTCDRHGSTEIEGNAFSVRHQRDIR